MPGPSQSPTEQSVSLTVTSRIIRGGSYRKGYQIINQDLQATVWVSTNPGMQPGQGTPISPGTSLVWATDDELFLILGSDAQSVLIGAASVILSYNTQLWQPNPAAVAVAALNTGQIIVDQPLTIVNGTFLNGTLPIQDLARYNSIYVSIFNNQVGAVYTQIRFRWFATSTQSILLGQDTVSFLGDPAYGLWTGQMPVKGRYLVVDISAPGTPGVSVNVIASFRQSPGGISQTIPFTSGPKATSLCSVTGVAVNAGISTVLDWVPPWFGDIEITLSLRTGAVAPVNVFGEIRGVSGVDAGTGSIYLSFSNGANGIYEPNNVISATGGALVITRRVSNWGNELAVAVFNQTAVNYTFDLLVQPVRMNP